VTSNPLHPMNQPAVLLVDDEPRYREMLVEAVTGMGFEARGVATAEQSLRALAQHPYGIVVLDLNLPGMNGMDLLEVIRREYPLVQLVILTGFGNLEAAKKAMRHDVVDFITKPCQLDELELSLSRAVRRRRASSPTTSAGIPQFGTEPSTSLEEIERSHILAAMKRHRGSRRAVAAELGVSLRTLYNRLREYKQTDSSVARSIGESNSHRL
jgi:DNA-binding NtrC family response regulator